MNIGIGDGQFEPDYAFTREEIAVIFAKFSKTWATPYLYTVSQQSIRTIPGLAISTKLSNCHAASRHHDRRFSPKDCATRGEEVAILHCYIKLTIDPATAQGWAKMLPDSISTVKMARSSPAHRPLTVWSISSTQVVRQKLAWSRMATTGTSNLITRLL